jgi:molybdopterin molybdotransferase
LALYKEFLDIKTLTEVNDILRKYFLPVSDKETIHILNAVGRSLASDIFSDVNIPEFTRATMDGYAVIAQDTFGISQTLPAYLKLIGEVSMGEVPKLSLNSGETMRISTGGMLPDSANAVVMVEYTNKINNDIIEIKKPVAIGENIIQIGEDIKKHNKLFSQGRLLQAYDIGALAAIGKIEIEVYRRLNIGIISTGDELVPPETIPKLGQIRDINSYILTAKIYELSCVPEYYGIVKDDIKELKYTIQRLIENNDMILICGGSSVGIRDLVATVLSDIGNILVHGVAIKPGKPTIIANVNNKPVIGLPGHPASSVIVFLILVQPFIMYLQNTTWMPRYVIATAARNIPSSPGREDYLRVKLIFNSENEYIAEPIFGQSGLIRPVFEADGLGIIPIDCEGISQGEKVKVMLI